MKRATLDQLREGVASCVSVVIKLRVDLCLERRDHTEVGIVFYCIILFVILRDEM